MKKAALTAFILAFFISGTVFCQSYTQLREQNRKNITNLSIGISMKEAMRIMDYSPEKKKESLGEIIAGPVGDAVEETVTGTVKTVGKVFLGGPEKAKNPQKSMLYKVGRKNIEVLYYYTDLKATDGAITEDELTPLVFADGKLAGWGHDFLRDYRKREGF